MLFKGIFAVYSVRSYGSQWQRKNFHERPVIPFKPMGVRLCRLERTEFIRVCSTASVNSSSLTRGRR